MLLMGKTEMTAINISSQGNGYILTIATGDSPSDVHIPSVAPAYKMGENGTALDR